MNKLVETLRAFQTLLTTVNMGAAQWLHDENVKLYQLLLDNSAGIRSHDLAEFYIEILEGHDHLCGWCHWMGDAHGTLRCPDCGDTIVNNRFAKVVREFKGGLGSRWPNGKQKRNGDPIT